MKRYALLSVVIISLLTLTYSPCSAGDKDNPEVEAAISRGVSYLISAQGSDGSWGNGPGTAALALLAIVNNGAPEGSEATVSKAASYLVGNPKYDKVYETALLAMALQAVDSEQYKDVITRCADFLGSSQLPTGMWTYNAISQQQWDAINERFKAQQDAVERPGNSTNKNPIPNTITIGDNSNTQFALLGLRAARWADVSVNTEAIRNCQKHFMRSQNEDGGWGYRQYDPNARGSMTCAAIGSLCILDDVFKSGWYFERRKIRKNNVAKGIQWMRDHFSVTTNPGYGANYLYYMYSMERAGDLSGHKQFGEHDWYEEGCPAVCAAQNSDGSWRVNGGGRSSVISETSFAVLFLKKAQKFHGAQ